MAYELRPVRSLEDWRHLHEIRRAVLFAPERHSVDYDENHPDDRAEENIPFLLLLDGRPIGVTRLDLRGNVAVVRLVAIVAAEQGKGHGRMLNALVEAEARKRGVRTLHVNAALEAVGYYEKIGWLRKSWDTTELVGLAKDCVQMIKEL
jgi:N-acetylglutamate synthase-like GNAT family acetyltransferase